MLPSVPADESAADEFTALVRSRASLYSSLGDHFVEIPAPGVNKALALYSHEIVHVPLGAISGSAIMLTTMETLDAWAVVPATAAGLGVVLTGLWAKFSLQSPRTQGSLRADVAQDHDDFRAALSVLGSQDAQVDAVMAATWFEPRMDEARRTLFDPAADPEAGAQAAETVLAIGARTWALARVEQRRVQVVESAVASGVELLPESSQEFRELSGLDFTEIDAVAANISSETAAIAAVMDVEAEPFVLNPEGDDTARP